MQEIEKVRLFEGITYIDPAFVEEASVPLKGTSNVIWLKKLGAMAAAFVLIAAMLFSINAIFPAFAESLPLVGEVFRRLNSLGSNAPSYEGMVQTVGESAENNEYKVTVTEAYCDGEYVFFALHLLPKDTELLKMESLYTEEAVEGNDAPGWRILLNGEDAPGYDLPVFTRVGSYFESDPMKIQLPGGVGQDTAIHVEAFMGNLCGRDDDKAGQVLSQEMVCLAFDVTPNTRYNQQNQIENASIDGLELQSWSCSPSKLSITLAYPYFAIEGVCVNARTEDGLDLGEDLRESGDFGDGRYTFGDIAVQECSFIGPPDGTKRVIVTVYKELPGERKAGTGVFGEFTVDLETGDVMVTENYLEQGFEHQSIVEYAHLEKPERKIVETSPVPSEVPRWFNDYENKDGKN